MLITRHPNQLSMAENVAWLLEPQPTLDARLFDADNQMLPLVREQILSRANALVQSCVAPFPWWEVIDVVLCGSADSYYYNQFSDIDVKVVLQYKEAESIFGGCYQAYLFAGKCLGDYYKKRHQFHIGKRVLDIKVTFSPQERQLYSVLHRQWITEPSRHVMDGINPEEVIAQAEKICRETEEIKKEQAERINGKLKVECLLRMERFYNRLVRMKQGSAEGLMINKLLKYDGCLYEIKRFCKAELAKTLSF